MRECVCSDGRAAGAGQHRGPPIGVARDARTSLGPAALFAIYLFRETPWLSSAMRNVTRSRTGPTYAVACDAAANTAVRTPFLFNCWAAHWSWPGPAPIVTAHDHP
ncbi:hypothetical protein GCM10010336_65590 [Streptomyces goshikiensis]|nr:hypothetical protein GCM10010336_65590 [Streptomyces goshikiensis]